MPIIKSAKKALRQTKRRTKKNQGKKSALKLQLTKFRKEKNAKQLGIIYSLVDKMVKNKIIHKNKAGRIKSRLAKSLKKQAIIKTPSKLKKRASKKKNQS